MKRILKTIVSFLLITLIMSSGCSKKSTGNNDRELPVVTLQTPTNNQSFTAGQTIQITGQISDNNRIGEVHVHISDLVTGNLLVDIHRYPDAATYSLSESIVATAGVEYRIQVIARDNAANEGRSTVNVTVN